MRGQRHEAVALVLDLFEVFFGDQRLQILIEDFAFLVGEILEALERFVQFFFRRQIDAELVQAGLERVAPRELAEREAVVAPADRFGAHDLVGFAVFQHAILMNAGFVRKSVGADDRLVRLHRIAGDAGDQFGRRHDLRGVDAGVAFEEILPRAHRHHHFFERSIAGALAESVDSAFDLARAIGDGSQRIGDRKAEIVMAMHRPHRLIGIRNALAQIADQAAELLRHRVADGIRHVDGRRPRFDHLFEDAAQKIEIRTAGVFGRKLDIVGVFARPFDRAHSLVDHLRRLHAQFLFHVDRAGRDEGVNAR